MKAISDKIPPLSQADEGVLIVRLPLLSAALEAADPGLLQDVTSDIHSDGGLFPAATQLLEGLTDYVLGDQQRLSSAIKAGASSVHALLKNGFDRNLDCPAKPLLDGIKHRIFASSDDHGAMKNCLNYLSLVVSHYF